MSPFGWMMTRWYVKRFEGNRFLPVREASASRKRLGAASDMDHCINVGEYDELFSKMLRPTSGFDGANGAVDHATLGRQRRKSSSGPRILGATHRTAGANSSGAGLARILLTKLYTGIIVFQRDSIAVDNFMSVKHTLLALLDQQPMHGYELGKRLKLVVNAEWDVKPGQVASTLARLKDANLVDFEVEETDDAPDRKVYAITEEGRKELEDWYLSPEVRDYRLGDAFYIKLVLSLVGGPVPPEQVLMNQRRELYRQLHEVTQLAREADPRTQLPWLLLLESAIMHLEADLRWIEMCEARLPDLKHYTPPEPEPKRRGRPRRKLTSLRKAHELSPVED